MRRLGLGLGVLAHPDELLEAFVSSVQLLIDL